MSEQNNNTLQVRLLLNHIISTFNVKLGMLWIADTGSFYIATKNGNHNAFSPGTLSHYLSGYYYRFVNVSHNKNPILVENLYETPNHPQNLLKLAKVENIKSLLISPILLNNYVKGTVILGSDDLNILINLNYELFKLLTNLAPYLNENNHSNSDIRILDQTADSLGLIVGESQQMQEIYKTILKISQSDANVFIYGESGTGKELIARTIHFQSRRKNQAFIPVDCVALPESLLESELFGYEKGAFTGANN
ncbi:MAG: sigma 54-interacting transcriptional regulator, partial [bacterium]